MPAFEKAAPCGRPVDEEHPAGFHFCPGMPLELRSKILRIANVSEDTTDIEHEDDPGMDDVTESDAHSSEGPCQHDSDTEAQAVVDIANKQEVNASIEPTDSSAIEAAEQRSKYLQSKIKADQTEARAAFLAKFRDFHLPGWVVPEPPPRPSPCAPIPVTPITAQNGMYSQDECSASPIKFDIFTYLFKTPHPRPIPQAPAPVPLDVIPLTAQKERYCHHEDSELITGFHFFPYLPKNVRYRIWKYAATLWQEPHTLRIHYKISVSYSVDVYGEPSGAWKFKLGPKENRISVKAPLLHVCRESRIWIMDDGWEMVPIKDPYDALDEFVVPERRLFNLETGKMIWDSNAPQMNKELKFGKKKAPHPLYLPFSWRSDILKRIRRLVVDHSLWGVSVYFGFGSRAKIMRCRTGTLVPTRMSDSQREISPLTLTGKELSSVCHN